jgi:hypothetical protein
VEVIVDDGSPVTATDLDNGTYRASVFSLNPRVVEIEMNGVPIEGSPFDID